MGLDWLPFLLPLHQSCKSLRDASCGLRKPHEVPMGMIGLLFVLLQLQLVASTTFCALYMLEECRDHVMKLTPCTKWPMTAMWQTFAETESISQTDENGELQTWGDNATSSSGYLRAGPDTFYFYWLVRSEKSKPLILWSLGQDVAWFKHGITFIAC